MEQESTYPYPLRNSEIARRQDILNSQPIIELTTAERTEVKSLDETLFKKIEPIINKTIEDHAIFPQSFLDTEGKRIFSALYLSPDNFRQVSSLAQDNHFDISRKDTERQVFDAYFDDLLSVCSSEQKYDEYLKDGIVFSRLTELLKSQIILKGQDNTIFCNTEAEIAEKFYQCDLKILPRRIRERSYLYSLEKAKNIFQESFFKNSGNVATVENPVRLGRVVNPELLAEKLQDLRDLKKQIKQIKADLAESNPDQAKKVVCNLYQRYINVLLAANYHLIIPINDNPFPSEAELKLRQEFSADIFPNTTTIRKAAKMDAFLRGVGLKLDKQGMFQKIPDKLSEYAKARDENVPQLKTETFLKYNEIKVNAEQARRICEQVLEYYGLTTGEKPWKVIVQERTGGLAVLYDKKEDLQEVRIPKNLKRGVVSVLGVIAHEVEGHVLRYANKFQALNENLKIISELSTGRGGLLSEAAAMSIESKTLQNISGSEKKALPYYYLTLQAKACGGSFKECFSANYQARARREYGIGADQSLQNPEIFQDIFNEAYDSTLRIFRNYTPFNDVSGKLLTTEQLDYLEQELLVEVLDSQEAKDGGVSKILYVAGVDLFSFRDLLQLGELDLKRVKEPEMFVSTYVWPRLKTSLDAGLDLDTAIHKLSSD